MLGESKLQATQCPKMSLLRKAEVHITCQKPLFKNLSFHKPFKAFESRETTKDKHTKDVYVQIPCGCRSTACLSSQEQAEASSALDSGPPNFGAEVLVSEFGAGAGAEVRCSTCRLRCRYVNLCFTGVGA